jgi:carboxypeptidase T
VILEHTLTDPFIDEISNNPNVDEEKPEVLYTAIHHAREPASLSQTIFYMWYLLENYETSEEVRFLIDHTEMYFIPVVNPDGYIIN